MTISREPSSYAYIAENFAVEDDLLQEIRTAGEKLMPGMQVSAVEGRLLQWLARSINAENILEIGSFVGYSSLWLARALPTNGKLISLEYNPVHAQIAESFFTKTNLPIELRPGKALETLDKMAEEKPLFDLIFIDAAKMEYTEYLSKTAPLLRKGGLLIADNTLLFGALHDEPRIKTSAKAIETMRNFNHQLASSPDWDSMLIPTMEGLTVARKLQLSTQKP